MKIFNNKNECCGCMACVDSCPKKAIDVRYDYKGFLYPQINKRLCIECGKCTEVCAFQNPVVDNNKICKQVYACKHKNYRDRQSSSSGGAYTAISDFILKRHGVVYGACYQDNDKVVFLRCTTQEQRNLTRGSKYVQGDMRGIYKSIKSDLLNGTKVLFAGTPCQCSQVKRIMGHFDNLYLVDIICHGVPSPQMFKKHIAFIQKETKKEVKEFLFREKFQGQCGRNKNSCVIFDDESIDRESSYIQVYFKLFNENKILRPACFSCKYSNENRMGDITIGDFWGIEKAIAEFDDQKGVSALIVNTPKGKELFEGLIDKIEFRQSSYDIVAKHNPNLLRSSKIPSKDKMFWIMYRLMGYKFLIYNYSKKSSFLKMVKLICKKFKLIRR